MAKEKQSSKSWRPATQAVRGGLRRSQFSETCEAMFMTSGYVYGSATEAEGAFVNDGERYVYSRFGNPTVEMFQQRLAAVEGAAHCRATASGMAAIYASLVAQVKSGDRIVASRALFGSCHHIVSEMLPRFGIDHQLVDGTDDAQWVEALSKPTTCVLVESPSNPGLEVIDIRRVSDLAHKAGARVIVDNAFASPILQKPLELGADIVVYSTTKHIDGQGRGLGGAILSNDTKYVDEQLTPFLRHTGPAMSPYNAWMCLKSLETLELRITRQSDNALKIAHALEGRKGIDRVLYPGLESHPQHALSASQMVGGGTMIALDITGGKDGAFKVLDGLEIIDISNNLGDSKSLITHPATTTHQRLGAEERARMGIGDGQVRLSVGLEDADDLIEDLVQAL